MWWLVYALLAHVMNAGVFVVDKSLLATDSKISSPIRYAAWSGVLSGGAVLLLPFAWMAPTGAVLGWSLVAGVCWVAALWFSFTALKAGVPSIVVPLTGSMVPIFTWLIAALFLGERLDGLTVIALVTLVLGGAILSLRLSKATRMNSRVISAVVLSSLFYAAYFAVVKYVYIFFPFFLPAFAYTRMGVGVAGLILTIWLLRKTRSNKIVKARNHGKKFTMLIIAALVISKGFGMLALILQNYAINLGSVTVVNALQGTQYLFLLGLAALVSRYYPKLWKEEYSRVTLAQRLLGMGLVSIGLILLVV